MPPKIDLPSTSGRSSPALPSTPTPIGTPIPGRAATVTTPRAQQAPADSTMPPSRPPSRSNSIGAATQQRPRTPTPIDAGAKAEVKRPTSTPEAGASVLASRSPGQAVHEAAPVGSSTPSTSATPPKITEADVQKARGELLHELDELGKAIVAAGGDPAELEAARHPTEQSLTDALHHLSETEGDHAALTPEHLETIRQAEDFIHTGNTPASSSGSHASSLVAEILHEADASASGQPATGTNAATGTATGTSAWEKCARAGRILQAVLKRINVNDDFGPKGTVAASVANVAMRNFLAVWVPTLLRQYVSYGLEAGLEAAGAGPKARAVIGAIAPAGAVISLGLGAVRDRMAGTHTRTSEISRAIMGTAITGATTATLATGAMPAVAPLTAAFGLYCLNRDVAVQSRLRLTNKDNPVPDKKHWSMISLLYGADQGLVNAGMSLLASPSGAGAKVAMAGIQSGNALARATMNWLGENAEDLMFQGIPAVRSYFDKNQETKPLRLSIEDVGYRSNNVKNAILGPLAVRTGILACTLGTAAIAARYLGSEKAVEIASDLIVAGYNAVLYHPFANAGSAQPQVADTSGDAEHGHEGIHERSGTELTSQRGQPATAA